MKNNVSYKNLCRLVSKLVYYKINLYTASSLRKSPKTLCTLVLYDKKNVLKKRPKVAVMWKRIA